MTKQIIKLEKVAMKLDWYVTGDVGIVELLCDKSCDSISFDENSSKQEILKTIEEKINETNNDKFKERLETLHKVVQRIIRTTYEEKEENRETFFKRLLK